MVCLGCSTLTIRCSKTSPTTTDTKTPNAGDLGWVVEEVWGGLHGLEPKAIDIKSIEDLGWRRYTKEEMQYHDCKWLE